jgi:hypothetical protein
MRYKRFLENLSFNRFTEIIMLPNIETVKNGDVRVSMSQMMCGELINYTPEEFSRHLEHVINLMESYEKLPHPFGERPAEGRFMVYVREELGVILAKTSHHL